MNVIVYGAFNCPAAPPLLISNTGAAFVRVRAADSGGAGSKTGRRLRRILNFYY